MIIELHDAADPRVADYTGLTDVQLRRVREPAEGLYIAESPRVFRRALAAGHRPRSFLMTRKWVPDVEDVLAAYPDVPVFVGSPELLEKVIGFNLHRGALAAMHRPAAAPLSWALDGARRIAVLEDIVDQTNLGAIFRSAAALDVDAVLISPRCGDPLYRRSIRVSMGTVFQIPWVRVDDWPGALTLLRQHGFITAALALAQNAITLEELADRRHSRLALVLGTEGEGLAATTLAAADCTVRIPMGRGVDSLNVAAAAAVAFWACRPAQ
ncbi:TrmH family RNA methyltransferase [Arthrobacter sp. H14-L1]|uniref:TrmH family RNA methyltransferase n=1 Tax=Arthrobacter sp. H14-L1 TaxID=2996697 RepID=UPI00226FBBD6|nr:RNA methyltransferase [Arthrobacter sp. H14-L1]MCY0906485.1 RNA methyltransferase [Arthrobacter sp. H14-L1]